MKFPKTFKSTEAEQKIAQEKREAAAEAKKQERETWLRENRPELYENETTEKANEIISELIENGFSVEAIKDAFADGEWLEREGYEDTTLVEEIDSICNESCK